MKLTSHVHLVSTLRISESIPPLPIFLRDLTGLALPCKRFLFIGFHFDNHSRRTNTVCEQNSDLFSCLSVR